MNAYQKTLTEDQRYLMLAALAQDADYRLNSGILQSIVSQYGHAVSSDQVRTQMSWLAEQDLVSIDKLNEHTHVAQLTDRGLDVAHGRAQVPGVRRPRPDELS